MRNCRMEFEPKKHLPVNSHHDQSAIAPLLLQFVQIWGVVYFVQSLKHVLISATWQYVMAIDTAVGEEVQQRQGALKATHANGLLHVEPGHIWLEVGDCIWVFRLHLNEEGMYRPFSRIFLIRQLVQTLLEFLTIPIESHH